MHRSPVIAAAALAAMLLAPPALGGCAGRSGSPPPAVEEAPALRGMSPAEKRSLIASGFPVQVPVLGASVVGAAETEPGAAWIYEMETTATVRQAGEWYARMYQGANWTLTEGAEDVGTDAAVLSLAFAKGGARSTVRISPVDGRTSVSVSVGVGASAPAVF